MQATPEMIEHSKRRTNAHIASVNYFSSLLDKNFPEHDADKLREPLLSAYGLLTHFFFKDSWPASKTNEFEQYLQQHRQSNPHHSEAYANIADLQEEHIPEMVCDWFAMTNELIFVRRKCRYENVMDYYMRHQLPIFKYTPSQQKLIVELIQKIESRWELEKFLEI